MRRAADQCKVKHKNLRAEFTKRRQSLAASGGAALEPMQHQTLQEELFGARPSANAPAASFDATFSRILEEGKNKIYRFRC